MDVKEQGFKAAADIATGVTVANQTDSNAVIVTALTIIGRVVVELLFYIRQRRKEKQNDKQLGKGI